METTPGGCVRPAGQVVRKFRNRIELNKESFHVKRLFSNLQTCARYDQTEAGIHCSDMRSSLSTGELEVNKA